MRKVIVPFMLAGALALGACGSDTETQPPTEDQAAETTPTTDNLDGVWVHANSETAVPGLNAVIQDDTIRMNWNMEELLQGIDPVQGQPILGDGVFWAGTFDSDVPAEGSTTITSVRDEEAIEGDFMVSPEEEKEFVYENGVLSFDVTVGENQGRVEMERAGEAQ